LHGFASSESLLGKNTVDLVHPEDRNLVRQQIAERMDGRVQRHLKRRLLRVDGSHFFAEVTARAILTSWGQAVGQLVISQDITSRQQAEDKLVYLSLHDQLTGLYNRAYFEEELYRLQDGRRYPVSIIAVDVNGLKLVNDTFGHAMGDSLLRAAAQALKQALRQSDTLARVGGDEFALALPNADAGVAEAVLLRIRQAVAAHNAGPDFCLHCDELNWIPLSLSLGAATAVDKAQSLEELFRQADTEMYRDKQAQGTEFAEGLVQSLRDGRFSLRNSNYASQFGEKVSVAELIRAIKDRGSR
jgi:diguanylate cyclase (GGDEF)-like protein/PAS domain S-box-containing protein